MDTITIQNLEVRSKERIERLREDLASRLNSLIDGADALDICIYATGSLARQEANESSDLDAFFLLPGCINENPIGRIRDIQILNEVILTTKANGFPDFSNDGEYLEFIHIGDLIDHLGDREDDYQNMLTARMLLILESQFLYGSDLYEDMKRRVIERYFVDFHRHNQNFKPIFLLNDILRFWRTLCLNYENGRWWRTDDPKMNAKGHLSNLKLRFSRLNICFSFIARLLAMGPAVDMDQVVAVSRLTPLARIRELASSEPSSAEIAKVFFEEYNWFLESVSRPKDDVLDWISDKQQRVDAFSHADRFTEHMFAMVSGVAEKHGYSRYLVI